MSDLRIVSLLPSATEIVCALGLADALVAVTHECNYPAVVQGKPVITRSLLPAGLSSAEIDAAVAEQVTSDVHTLYTIDRDLLADLAPDLVVTQRLCDVCAVNYDVVQEALATLPHPPKLATTEPSSLEGMLRDVQTLGELAGAQREAERLVHSLRARIERVRMRVARATTRPRVAFLEWLDPLFCGGHWNPELVRLAGGEDGIGHEGAPSVRITWEQVRAFQPEVMVISCCGYDEQRARADLPLLTRQPGWESLPCVQSGRIRVVDGNAYFSRPGPRLVDSLELLAAILHPELCDEE